MRIGVNPEKELNDLTIESYHRVVIPVFIPNLEEDYFKDGLSILKLCLESLLLTIHSKTRVSLINNGCCEEVSSYMSKMYDDHDQIDQLLKSKVNLGKVNALFSAIKSNLEPLITISDADVMFLSGWQQATESIINDFPEAGMVSPVPSSTAYKGQYVNSTIFYGLFKGSIQFNEVKDPQGMIKFQESIGRKMYDEIHLKKYLTLKNKRNEAVLGCGHFVATMRAEIFKHAPIRICQFKIVGGSENEYIDLPNDKGGFLRLATMNNLAYHMGNTFAEWMDEDLDKIKRSNTPKEKLDSISMPNPIGGRGYFLGKIIHKLLVKKFKKIYFRIKGMKQAY